MKLECVCGNMIRDQTDNIPYKARFIADEDHILFWEGLVDTVLALIKARDEGKLAEFVDTFWAPGVARRTDLSKLDFLVLRVVVRFGRLQNVMYECERCGRLWIEELPDESGAVGFLSYLPETPARGALRSHRVELDAYLAQMRQAVSSWEQDVSGGDDSS